MNVSHSQLIISLRLKNKIDKYVNIVYVVFFFLQKPRINEVFNRCVFTIYCTNILEKQQ